MRPREAQVEVLRARAALAQLLAQAQEGHEAAPVGRRAHAHHLARPAQDDAQVARGLDLDLGDLARQLAEVAQERARALGAVAARLGVEQGQAPHDGQVEAGGARPVDVDERAVAVHEVEALHLGQGQGHALADLDAQRCRAGCATRWRPPPRARRAGAPSGRRCRGRGCSRPPRAPAARAPRLRRGSGCPAPRPCRRAAARWPSPSRSRSRARLTVTSSAAPSCRARIVRHVQPRRRWRTRVRRSGRRNGASSTGSRAGSRGRSGRRGDDEAALRRKAGVGVRSMPPAPSASLEQLVARRPHAARAERQHHVAVLHLLGEPLASPPCRSPT